MRPHTGCAQPLCVKQHNAVCFVRSESDASWCCTYRLFLLAPAMRMKFCQRAEDLLKVRERRNLVSLSGGLIEKSCLDLLEHHAHVVRLRERERR